jgi:hypothetical protein
MSPSRCIEPRCERELLGRRAATGPTGVPRGSAPKRRDPRPVWGRMVEGWPECQHRRHVCESRTGSKRFPYPNESCGIQTPSHGVSCSSTLTEAGSDLHQDYLAWLCCAFRFSQPLDALFRPQPLQPCFMPVTPSSLRFQRFPLPGSGSRLSAPPSLRAVS